jgi:hypothetical protein
VEGDVVGMVFAGCEERGIAFFTRIDDLFTDVKERTGAVEVRLAED